jgi:hypothetical protein
MKTIFTLFASLLLSAAVFATDVRPKSMLTVKSSDYGDIRVILDGRRFEPGDNSLMIRDLQPGYHQVRVYRARNNGGFTIFGQRYEMVYNSSLMIRPATQVRIMIDRFGRALVDERRINGNYYGQGRGWDRNNDWGNSRDSRDQNRDWEGNHDYNFDRDGKMGDYDNNYGYDRGMDDREFSKLLQSIQTEWSENNRMKSASQVLRSNSFTSVQVKQLLQLFSFENNKLDLAKQAYQNTVDKKNYYIINDVFSFSSSKAELANYIRNFR